MNTEPAPLPPPDAAADVAAPTSRVLPYSPEAIAVLANRVNLVEFDLDNGAHYNVSTSVTAGKRAKGAPAPFMPRGIAFFFANGYGLVAGLLAAIRERDAKIEAQAALLRGAVSMFNNVPTNDIARDAQYVLSFIGDEVPTDANLLLMQTGLTRERLRSALSSLVALNLVQITDAGALRVRA